MELEQQRERIRQQGLGVVAISYDSVAVLKNFAERRGIRYPLLSDPDSKVIRAFGILNESVPSGPFSGIPHPGTYIVDARGVVQAKYFEDDYRQRYTAASILTRQFGATAAEARSSVATKHLKLALGASNADVRSGERITLTIDVDLPSRMHVYAPSVAGYISIDWQLPDSDAGTAHAAVYPRSKMMRLEAIKETVPVYEDRFRLTRDVAIGADAKIRPLLSANGELVIRSALRYQACDDTKCYIPETVPLSWTLRVESHDRQRAPAELQRK